jgi:DNA-binding IclR family transcriptional regulator
VDLRQLARPALERLQDAFGDTAVLTETSRGEAVCSEVITGTYPVHANYVTVGTRRPLGVGAGSLAVLAWLPPAERARRLQQTARKLTNYLQLDAASIAAEADAACARGYVLFLDWVVEGMGGIAVPILDYDGWPIGALSVAALSTRIRSREVAMARLLRQEARASPAHGRAPWTRRGTQRAGPRSRASASGISTSKRSTALAKALP